MSPLAPRPVIGGGKDNQLDYVATKSIEAPLRAESPQIKQSYDEYTRASLKEYERNGILGLSAVPSPSDDSPFSETNGVQPVRVRTEELVTLTPLVEHYAKKEPVDDNLTRVTTDREIVKTRDGVTCPSPILYTETVPTPYRPTNGKKRPIIVATVDRNQEILHYRKRKHTKKQARYPFSPLSG